MMSTNKERSKKNDGWKIVALVGLILALALLAITYLLSDADTPESAPAPTTCESLAELRREADFYAGYIEANMEREHQSLLDDDNMQSSRATGAFSAYQVAIGSFGDLGELTFRQAGRLFGYMYDQGILDRYAGLDAITDHYAGVDAAIDQALAVHECER